MYATVRKITEIERTRVIEDGWIDEYTEGMEMLADELIVIRPMVIDGHTSMVWFEGGVAGSTSKLGNKFASFNWHISWLKHFQGD